MIIVKIIGGLGNQMFQLANGLAVAKRNGTVCKLDINGFQDYKLHNFSLDHFCLIPEIASESELRRYRPQSKSGLLGQTMTRLFGHSSGGKIPHHIKERQFTFMPEIMDLREQDIYLDGYWQSEKYFIDVADEIHEGFQVRTEPDSFNKETIARINASESVCVHIRRGDYVHNQQTQIVHGTATLNYYQVALEYLAKQLRDIEVFVFSDDPAWVKANLQTRFPTTYVAHNGPDKNYEDLRLMSTCKHHVIANSTFSWWSAWLAQTDSQIVIAPKKWFNTDVNTIDLIPSRWIRM